MIVDGKQLSAGERIRTLIGLERNEEPRQQELPLTDDDDMRYLWKDLWEADDDDERHRTVAGIIVAVVCSVPLLVLLMWWLLS